MHFSNPSGCRLSWCRPWNRGATRCRCSGYCSVTTLRKMVPKVTPKPATESRNLGTSTLPRGGLWPPRSPHRGGARSSWHGRNGVAAGEGVDRLLIDAALGDFSPAIRDDHADHQHQHDEAAAPDEDVPTLEALVEPQPHGRHQQDP